VRRRRAGLADHRGDEVARQPGGLGRRQLRGHDHAELVRDRCGVPSGEHIEDLIAHVVDVRGAPSQILVLRDGQQIAERVEGPCHCRLRAQTIGDRGADPIENLGIAREVGVRQEDVGLVTELIAHLVGQLGEALLGLLQGGLGPGAFGLRIGGRGLVGRIRGGRTGVCRADHECRGQRHTGGCGATLQTRAHVLSPRPLSTSSTNSSSACRAPSPSVMISI
jgi:hypothetical protein